MRFYALVDPRYGTYCYAGRTVSGLDDRRREHIRTSLTGKSNCMKAQWIRELASVGLFPTIELLEETDVENGVRIEIKWITALREGGHNLLNVAKPLDCVNKSHCSNWDEYHFSLLGVIPDDELAAIVGVTRKAVAYQRKKRDISPCGNRPEKQSTPPNMGGWNKLELPVEIIDNLGKFPDYVLAERICVSKAVISRRRRELGILSYAQQTGHNGKFATGNPHPRWGRKNT